MSPAVNDDELWPGLLEGLPDVFTAQASEPAFSYEGVLEATFCLWRQTIDDRWHAGVIDFPTVRGHRDDADGSGLLKILCDGSGDRYMAFAADYYELQLDQAAVEHIFALRPLSEHVVTALKPELTLAEVAQDATTIGYPLDGSHEDLR